MLSYLAFNSRHLFTKQFKMLTLLRGHFAVKVTFNYFCNCYSLISLSFLFLLKK